MKKLTLASIALIAISLQAAPVVNEDFSAAFLNESIWNDGGGFESAIEMQVVLTSFGQKWGSRGDAKGTAGLNSPVGSASFTVSDTGELDISVGGFFQIGNNTYSSYSDAIARIDLSTKGSGNYELIWNNSGEKRAFTTASGWNGTLDGNSYVWLVDGKRNEAVWGKTDAAENITVGKPANRFGFYVTSESKKAIIKSVKIYDTTEMK